MALIKLHKANELGEDAGIVFLNADQIVSIASGPNVTEVLTVDGHTHWIKESPDDVAAQVKAAG